MLPVKPFPIAVLVFALVTVCNGQQSTQQRSIGERLLSVEDELRSHPGNIGSLRKAETELKSILESDPQTVFRSQVESQLAVVHERLANHDLLVASFYMSKTHGGSLRGAESRLSNIVRSYPEFSKTDEVLFRLGLVNIAQEKPDDGSRTLWRLICRFPDSEYVRPAFARLYEIGIDSWEGCEQFKL